MSLSATTIWEVESGGSDTNNGGAFDPGQTAGMFTDGAATSATGATPSFTSASYNFVVGDVGAWIYIASGTSWTPGWYKITAAPANAATLQAGVGTVPLKSLLSMNTVAGCGTTTPLSGATWTIDYSQQTGSQITYTDLSSTGVGLTCSSAAHAFGKQQVGNAIVITGGTNFNTGRYIIASVSGVTATVLGAGNLHSGAGTDSDGAGRQGGALASPGQSAAAVVNGNTVFVKQATYSIASASTNVATGCISLNGSMIYIGYNTNRIWNNTDTKPILQTNASTATTWVNLLGEIYNFAFDGNGQTAARAVNNTSGNGVVIRCTFTNFNTASTGGFWINCSATANSATVLTGSNIINCEAYANTALGINLSGNGAIAINCLAYSNTGGTTDGIQLISNQCLVNCTAYANGRDGITSGGGSFDAVVLNCHSEQNAANDYKLASSSSGHPLLINSSYYFTGSGAGVVANTNLIQIGVIALSATAFVNAAGLDFSLNNNSGAGASIRNGSYVGAFPHASTTSYLDIGAVQHLAVTLGFGGLLRLIGVGGF